jgi:Fe-S-cluster-containing dehydrogenase component
MKKLALLTDIDLCIGCLACETACKQEHNLPVSTKWMSVVRVGPVMAGGRLVMDFVPMHCRHCENPPCMVACPVGAISKRSDGIVLYNEETCIGCKQCIEACPFGAAQYNPDVQRAQACNLCVERVDQGLLPACAQNCPTQALVFGPPEDFALRKRKAQAQSFLSRRFPDSQGLP